VYVIHRSSSRVSARERTHTHVAVPPGVVFVLEIRARMHGEASIADPTILTSAFDPFVAVLVEAAEVLPHLLLPTGYNIPLANGLEPPFKVSNSICVKLVLMALQVSQLCKLLVACIKFASEGLGGRMHDLVGAHISSLRKCLATNITTVRSFSSVSSLVSLEIAQLRESLTTSGLFANLCCVRKVHTGDVYMYSRMV